MDTFGGVRKMDGKFDTTLTLLAGGKQVDARGPISWNPKDPVTSASLQVAITQGDVAALGHTESDLTQSATGFSVKATTAGIDTLSAGPAIATGWAFLRGEEGVTMYEWSVPVKLENGSAH
jgi:hypothetical protein